MGPNISVELGGAGGLGPALHLQPGAFQESHADQENDEAVFRHRWVIHRKTEVPTRQPRPRLVFNTNRDPTVNRSWGEQEGWGLFIGLLPARVLISCRL
jgi:hypothetical protein